MDIHERSNRFRCSPTFTLFLVFSTGILCELIPFAASASASPPFVPLGKSSSLGFSQPTIGIELFDGNTSLGPSTANRFVLDTGANGILIGREAYSELATRGYAVDGTIREQGAAGFEEFDVSAPYTFRLTDHARQSRKLSGVRAMSSDSTSFCQLGFCPFYGVAGMPAMADQVVSLDLLSGDLLDTLGLGDGIDTTFSNDLPSARRRYSVPVRAVHFEPDASGPSPTWSDLPFIQLDPIHLGLRQTGSFLLDTGAQISFLSSHLAIALGLDKNGNGSLLDEAESTIPVGGIGGTIDVPQLTIDQLRFPTSEGVELVFDDVQFGVLDISPEIDGIVGMNLLTGGLDLLGGLGGGEEGSYFTAAHFDFRQWSTKGAGTIYLDVKDDVPDVQIPPGGHGDLNGDGVIDFADRVIWVEDVNHTYFGDSNLDGVFDSSDFVLVFRAAEFEDDLIKNSTWATGDWNGDWEFNTRDFVTAFQAAGYNQPPRPQVGFVPEPSGSTITFVLVVLWASASRGRCPRRIVPIPSSDRFPRVRET